jgi:RND family efflux transporter MFP subunit
VGALVGNTTPYPLMTIVDDASFSIKSDISEVDLDKVSVGQPVEVTIDAIPGTKFEGRITEINPSASQGTRTYTIKVDVANRDRLMKSGMFARGSVRVQSQANVLKVPKDAIIKRGGEQGVIVVKNCKASTEKGSKSRTCEAAFEVIETGIVNTLTVQVTKGLNEGDEVVLVGAAGLNTGDKISVEKTSKMQEEAE